MPRFDPNSTNSKTLRVRAWRQANPEKRKAAARRASEIQRQKRPGYHAELHREQRYTAIARYGGKCACCSESDRRFLTFDHIVPVGRSFRRKQTALGRKLWIGPLDTNIQILCYNCNCGRQHNSGVCPHEVVNVHTFAD